MKRALAKIVMAVGLASVLFQVNFPQAVSVAASSRTPMKSVSTDLSKPEHGRALALVRQDMNMARAGRELTEEGRKLKLTRPTFIYIGTIEGDTTGGDWYAVAFKADKNEDDQSIVMATIDVKNEVVVAVSVFRAGWDTEDKTAAYLNLQELRGRADETKNKTMFIRDGRAFDEDGNMIRGKTASLWGTQALAAVTTCDVVCTVVWAVTCWLLSMLLTGGLAIVIGAIACAVVALYYCDEVCH